MQTCKTCRHLGPDNWLNVPADWHSCLAVENRRVLAMVEDGETLYVSLNFGCVMHETDTETVHEDDGD